MEEMVRIDGNLSTQLNPTGMNPFGAATQRASTTQQAPEVGQQVQQVLFGKPTPPVLDPAKFPHLAEQLRLLRKFKGKLAAMANDRDEDYSIVLADGTIAMIDASGTIFVGAQFLQACRDQPEVLVGVLAHEIGHRPKRWGEYKTRRQLSREELEMLCRHEETRADIFSGKALAEMGMSPEPLVAFLLQIQDRPHPEYFSAEVRAEVIRDAHAGRQFRTKMRRSLFPGYDRMTSPKGHLGEY